MDEFLHDLRHGARQLARRPGFAAVAVVSLALGIGLNTTLFSVVNAVLFATSPLADPDRLVEIYSSASATTTRSSRPPTRTTCRIRDGHATPSRASPPTRSCAASCRRAARPRSSRARR